jgi:hypothetical protein
MTTYQSNEVSKIPSEYLSDGLETFVVVTSPFHGSEKYTPSYVI